MLGILRTPQRGTSRHDGAGQREKGGGTTMTDRYFTFTIMINGSGPTLEDALEHALEGLMQSHLRVEDAEHNETDENGERLDVKAGYKKEE